MSRVDHLAEAKRLAARAEDYEDAAHLVHLEILDRAALAQADAMMALAHALIAIAERA